MSVWVAAPVNQVPGIVLRNWSIRQLPNGDRHFVGYNDLGREGRVSTKIVEFDVQRMRGKTRSGRVYELYGRPGFNGDAEYVWGAWCQINRVDTDTVVHVDLQEIEAVPTEGSTL